MITFNDESDILYSLGKIIVSNSEITIGLEPNYLKKYEFLMLHINRGEKSAEMTVRVADGIVLRVYLESLDNIENVSSLIRESLRVVKLKKYKSPALFMNMFMESISPILL